MAVDGIIALDLKKINAHENLNQKFLFFTRIKFVAPHSLRYKKI